MPSEEHLATVRRLADAARAGDMATARALLEARPELVNFSVAENDEHRALHHAVIGRHPEMVRLLMQHGADPRLGIWPHRDATCPIVMARERGYTEIVEIVQEEASRQNPALASAAETPAIVRAFQQGDETAIVSALDSHPALVHASDQEGRTALHWAAMRLWPKLAAWLLEHEADVGARTQDGDMPLDLLAEATDATEGDQSQLIANLAEMLVARGSERTARWAIVANDANWLRARHAEGALSDHRGLVTHAIRSDRLEMLRLLLDLGLDPDESDKVGGLDEIVPTFGEPLRECASSGRLAMAACLLQHGANPNTNVYAASSALSNAYQRRDDAMIALLEGHGARLDPASVGLLGLTSQAATLLADQVASQGPDTSTSPASNVAAGLMWGAIESHSPEIVRMALRHVDWPRGDARWYGILQNGFHPSSEGHRAAHLEGLRLALDRADPNIRTERGETLLHYVAAAHGSRTADDRLTYASMLLDAGARLDLRDDLLQSTPLGWACRWGRLELVRLFLERGADPIEPGAESWATPVAWAEKMNRSDVLALLRQDDRFR